MKLKIPLSIIIGLILGIILPNIFSWAEINRLKNRIMRKDDEIIGLHKTIDSLKEIKHIYDLDFAERRAYDRQAFYPADTIYDTAYYYDSACYNPTDTDTIIIDTLWKWKMPLDLIGDSLVKLP